MRNLTPESLYLGAITNNDNIDPAVSNIMASSVIWDNHSCLPLRADDYDFLPKLNRYKASGVDIVSVNVGYDVVPWENTLAVATHFRRWIHEHDEEYLQVETANDVEEAKRSNRLGIVFDIEGGCSLNRDSGMIQRYYDLGVRWMLMAYNKNNALGGGCQDDDQGLTQFGRDVIREMERVGMVVCCSHTGIRTSMEVMEFANKPVIFSHSNPYGVKVHPRNIKDDVIRACADRGGVIGINGIGNFLGNNDNRTETIVRHIDYVVQMVGSTHVGLGLDYVFDQQELDDFVKANPDTFPPELGYGEGLKLVCPEQIPEIAGCLLTLGYSDYDLQLILGLNHLRIARSIWKS